MTIAPCPLSCYIYPMTVTQTVEIPANRRLIIDVPHEIPPGQVILTFTPKAAAQTEAQEQKKEREWVNPLLGLGKTMGSTLTLDGFREMQQEEIAREIENDQRLLGKK